MSCDSTLLSITNSDRHINIWNKIYNSLLQKNVIPVREMVQSQVQVQIDVLIVGEMEGFEQIRVSSLYNKHVHSAQEAVKKLLILAMIVMVKATNNLQKKYQ